MFRKVISQTKGGKLAEAAYPAKVLPYRIYVHKIRIVSGCCARVQVVALILSDVINDPVDIIASGPTVPNTVTKLEVLQLLEKYNLKHKVPLSILFYLQAEEMGVCGQFPIKNGCYLHTQNVVIGNNRTATQAARSAAEGLGYSCHVWSHRIQGEARDIGTVYAKIAHSYLSGGSLANVLQEKVAVELMTSSPALQEDLTKLVPDLSSPPFCLISAGEPTVTVKEGATGVGGRSQELALAYAVELGKLSSISDTLSHSCVLACVGTDGQDGPNCDAAGAMVDMDTAVVAEKDGLRFLDNNDSHGFFSRLSSGQYLIHTGLTGTNVMDIHILVVK